MIRVCNTENELLHFIKHMGKSFHVIQSMSCEFLYCYNTDYNLNFNYNLNNCMSNVLI
jgi:hypothetical protein